MFTEVETKLLNADNAEFPLIAAAKSALDGCRTCGHANVNVHSMLRVAVNKYKRDKRFRDHCARLFRLPVSIAGIFVEN